MEPRKLRKPLIMKFTVSVKVVTKCFYWHKLIPGLLGYCGLLCPSVKACEDHFSIYLTPASLRVYCATWAHPFHVFFMRRSTGDRSVEWLITATFAWTVANITVPLHSFNGGKRKCACTTWERTKAGQTVKSLCVISSMLMNKQCMGTDLCLPTP